MDAQKAGKTVAMKVEKTEYYLAVLTVQNWVVERAARLVQLKAVHSDDTTAGQRVLPKAP